MLGPIRNRKEISKSLNNNSNNYIIKEKLNNLNKINNLDTKLSKQNTISSSLFNTRINLKSILNNNNNNSTKDHNKKVLFLSELRNKNIFAKYNKKNKLAPINQKILQKAHSVNNLFQNNNNLDILSSRKTINNPKNLPLQKIKQTFNNSSYNNNNTNNITGFNSTKNNNNITNYSISKNNSNYFLSSYNNNFSETRIPKKKKNFSKFFYKSQSKFITSKKIFKHYIKEEERDKVVPIKYFKKGGAPKSIKELKELYKDNIKFERRLKELKCNSTIAFKEDFNILEYQTTLVKLLSNRISEKNLHEFQKQFVLFNEKNFGMTGPKGRFTNMAEKIKYNIPLYLYEKIKQLDTDKLISRYNYYKKINENIRNKFRKKYENKKKKKKKNEDTTKEDNIEEMNNSY